MNTFIKTFLILVCAFCLAGCAPHYFNFKLTDQTTSSGDLDIDLQKASIVARHLPSNEVDIYQNIILINVGEAPVSIGVRSFAVKSSMFNYELHTINMDTGGIKNPGEGTTLYSIDTDENRLPVFLKPQDSIDLTVIHSLPGKMDAQEYRKLRVNEELTVTIKIDETKFELKYIATEEDTPF